MSAATAMRVRLEMCIDTPAGLAAAVAGGADRVELTSALALGGLTPSRGFMLQARGAGIPAMVMIRPRAGGFVFTEGEIAQMLADIAEVRALGLTGVVLGAARPDGTLDTGTLKRLIDAAGSLETTLHRVFDLVPDPFAALEQAIALGFTRILTSGLKPNVADGLDLLEQLGVAAGSRISIMPGAGVTPRNAGDILARTGAREIHASCARTVGDAEAALVGLGFAAPGPVRQADAASVAEMRRALDQKELKS